MTKYLCTLLSFVFVGAVAQAAPIIEEDGHFQPDHWSKGLHLLVGGVLNSGVYVSDARRQDFGLGPVLKTEVSYVFHDRFAVEWNSVVKFNFVDGYTVWDTIFSLGGRYRFDPMTGMKGPFMRAFFGRTVNVLYFNSSPPIQYSSYSRLQ
jgi:hypothetical protein